MIQAPQPLGNAQTAKKTSLQQQSVVYFEPPTQESIQLPTKMEKNKSVEKTSEAEGQEVLYVSDTVEKPITLPSGLFEDQFLVCIQNGYKSKKEFQTAPPEADYSFALKISEDKEETSGLTSEDINNEKMTFRSGYQAMGSEDQQADLDRILKGCEFPKKITREKMYGSMNGANGHNGYLKNSLYEATYLDPDGVGPRK